MLVIISLAFHPESFEALFIEKSSSDMYLVSPPHEPFDQQAQIAAFQKRLHGAA
jgi:hypothetical protein